MAIERMTNSEQLLLVPRTACNGPGLHSFAKHRDLLTEMVALGLERRPRIPWVDDFTCRQCHGCVAKSCSRGLQAGIGAMEILRIKGVRILDEEFRALLQAVCGFHRKGGVFEACVQNPGVCDQLLRFLALRDLGAPLIAAGSHHTCAVKVNGDLVCFGSKKFGKCNVPSDLGPVVAAAAGHYHTCAVRANGDLVCFGDNHRGQCDVPEDFGPVVAVAAGYSHTCALGAKGELICFGDNCDGQCNVPPNLGPVVAVAAGFSHTCALGVKGDLICFGDHQFGQCDVPVDLGALRFAPPNQKTCFKPCPVELAVVHRVDH